SYSTFRSEGFASLSNSLSPFNSASFALLALFPILGRFLGIFPRLFRVQFVPCRILFPLSQSPTRHQSTVFPISVFLRKPQPIQLHPSSFYALLNLSDFYRGFRRLYFLEGVSTFNDNLSLISRRICLISCANSSRVVASDIRAFDSAIPINAASTV